MDRLLVNLLHTTNSRGNGVRLPVAPLETWSYSQQADSVAHSNQRSQVDSVGAPQPPGQEQPPLLRVR